MIGGRPVAMCEYRETNLVVSFQIVHSVAMAALGDLNGVNVASVPAADTVQDNRVRHA